jgi:beta-galactosidase
MYEFKKLVQPVDVCADNISSGDITVHNRQYYSTLEWLRGSWEVTVDGILREQGELPPLDTGPGFHTEVRLNIPEIDISPGQECHITIRFFAKQSTP